MTDKKTKTTQVRMDENLYNAIKQLADKDSRSISGYIRKSLKESAAIKELLHTDKLKA